MRCEIACIPIGARAARAPGHIAANAARAAAAVASLARRLTNLKIAVLPQGVLSGGGEMHPTKADLEPLARAAADAGLYLALADRFDDGLFGLVIGPTGAILARQPSITEGVGAAEVTVVSTPFGELACLPGEDVAFAEYARLAVFKGAEIVLNPTFEFADQRTGARHLLRGARSWENFVILASAGLGAVLGDDGLPDAAASGTGHAEIRNFSAEMLASGQGQACSAVIDVAALRRRRDDPWINYPAQLRSALYAEFYDRAARAPRPLETRADGPVYDVLMMQVCEKFTGPLETRERIINENLDNALSIARGFAAKPTTKLVVFPEFFLQGSPPGTLDYWEKAGIRIPGPETERLAAFARDCQVYVCGAVLEYDPDWPRRYFNTSIVIAPSGEIVLRYRKLQCADLQGLLNVTTPGNIYSAYVQRYGMDALIPVVDTPIGKLGTAICFDSNWPELWRTMALKGAEVICNPTSEIHSDRVQHWYAAKRAHAAENMVYVASANAGAEQFMESRPITSMNRGHSCLIDYHGNLAAHADGPGIVPLVGRIDLGVLRRARATLAENALARFRPEAVAQAYRDYPGFPLDCFLAAPMEKAAEGPPLVRRQIERLKAAGVYRSS
ncbi:MAG: nitrilase-related carbon-nitrogen hydrolase [Rhodospirillaceae bacterium]|nr:nitrilase-related carbon-nitrogen hydrolase [Rhodospirillaceae bacterium]